MPLHLEPFDLIRVKTAVTYTFMIHASDVGAQYTLDECCTITVAVLVPSPPLQWRLLVPGVAHSRLSERGSLAPVRLHRG